MEFDSSRFEYDIVFGFIIIGDAKVGKSSFLNRFLNEDVPEAYIHTLGADYKVFYTSYASKKVKLRFWDTSGQERFGNMPNGCYYYGSNAIIFV